MAPPRQKRYDAAMNCIVTAGPTFESLDDVRRLTNFSTGRLGTELANYLVAQGHQVTLLIGEAATWPGERRAQSVKSYTSTRDLRAKLKALSRRRIDVIFHAAAVSDYGFGRLYRQTAAGELQPFQATKKIATQGGKLLVELVPTPKIIAELRGWYPCTRIIGWKYEADGGRASALRAAKEQILRCHTDACVANGPAYGQGFSLVTTKNRKHLGDSTQLFAALVKLAAA
ncbi:MAG TPA: phosphopantothenoylcysteine decarboxylase [Verrucomicrobiae bacterium]